MNKIWQVESRGLDQLYTDQELIQMISDGQLNGEDVLINTFLKTKVKIKETIYAYYLKENTNEKTIEN